MSYAQLKAFHAVALEGSIQKAAARLNLTQPAVSIQLKSLESDSGKALFRRKGHSLQLTADGQALFESTSRMFRAEEEAHRILEAPQGRYRGTLVLGADGPHVALDLIEAFRSLEPHVRVRVVLANAAETWENLLDLKVDAAVLAGAPDDPRVQRKTLAKQGLVALLPADHALATEPSIDLERLLDHPLLFRERGSSTQKKLESAVLGCGLRITPAITLGSREAIREAVLRRMGIGFVYSREAGTDDRLAAIPVIGLEEANVDELVCLKAQRASHLVERLFRCGAVPAQNGSADK